MYPVFRPVRLIVTAALLAGGLLQAPLRAAPVTVNFEADTPGAKPDGFQSVATNLVSFSDTLGANLSVVDAGVESSGQGLVVAGDDTSALQMDFATPICSLSLLFGNDDPNLTSVGDQAILTVFDGPTQVGQAQVLVNRNDAADQTIAVQGVTFNRAVFRYADSGGNSVNLTEVVDNVVFVPGSAPEFVGATPTAGATLNACVGQPLQVPIQVDDTDSDSVTLAASFPGGTPINPSGNPNLGTALNTSGGSQPVTTLTLTPTAGSGSTYPLSVTVTDPDGCVVTRVLNIQVATGTPPSFNRPPTPGDGQTYVLCVNRTFSFNVQGIDPDDADTVTLSVTGTDPRTASGVPLGATHDPDQQGDGAGNVLVVRSGDELLSSRFTWTPTAADVGNYTLTYRLEDNQGCVTATTVNLSVQLPQTTTIEVERISGDTFFGLNETLEQCFRITVLDQCGDPIANETVTVTVEGDTGSNQTTTVVTDENGEAIFCYTPLFPGTDVIRVGADGVLEQTTFSILVPENTRARVYGNGYVSVGGIPAFFSLNSNVRRNGRVAGSVNAELPLGATVLTFRSLRINTLIAGPADPSGRAAILFGVGRVRGRGVNERVRFRVDALDLATPGVPNDQFILTLLPLNGGGPVLSGVFGPGVVSLGGPLSFVVKPRPLNDIRIEPTFVGAF